ncbi:MAG: hypothetical protein WCP58_07680 [bacterium]
MVQATKAKARGARTLKNLKTIIAMDALPGAIYREAGLDALLGAIEPAQVGRLPT